MLRQLAALFAVIGFLRGVAAASSLENLTVSHSPLNLTIGSTFELTIRNPTLSFWAVLFLAIPPNGTRYHAYGPLIGSPNGPLLSVFTIDPSDDGLLFDGNVNTTVVVSDPLRPSECVQDHKEILELEIPLTTVGNWTFTPYIQYFFSENGYQYDGEKACLYAPIIVETVPLANITLQVTPGANGETTVDSATTTITPNQTSFSPASFQTLPTGEPFAIPTSAGERTFRPLSWIEPTNLALLLLFLNALWVTV